MTQASIHGYTTAFWWSAAILGAGAVATALLLKSGAPRTEAGEGEEGNLAMAH